MCYQIGHSLHAKQLPLRNAIVYGFLDRVLGIAEIYETNRVVFLFDSHSSVRRKQFPEYKAARKVAMTESAKRIRDQVHKQSAFLRETMLPSMGFRNVFMQEGLEADDLIAKICEQDQLSLLIIVSQDEDLYQCLSPNVRIFKPRTNKEYTYKRYKSEWGLDAFEWADIKAIAGCKSDNIPGIEGVGEKTAAKYMRNERISEILKDRIEKSDDLVARNFDLVCLPHSATAPIKIEWDEFEPQEFGVIADSNPFFHTNMWRWKRFFAGAYGRDKNPVEYRKDKMEGLSIPKVKKR